MTLPEGRPYTAEEAREFERQLLAKVEEMIRPGGIYQQLRVVSEEILSVGLEGAWPDTELVVRTRGPNGDEHRIAHRIWDVVREEGPPRHPYTLQGTAQILAAATSGI
jgi:hypothetical protein